ncbi:hypothetical protein OXYTRIMIC_750 [Oxytricha trifallax]|uniref:Uncharacterized protein n=1 Tax=Oxytricha trifallax TaxID=1172189 RepID=A0A073IC55_9SPIT|nr:hypothetical protein OXYTRIMIC_750 [Oxytricha trifallax]
MSLLAVLRFSVLIFSLRFLGLLLGLSSPLIFNVLFLLHFYIEVVPVPFEFRLRSSLLKPICLFSGTLK